MKLRSLGVALLASCGLAIAALPATAALAVDDAPQVGGEAPVTSDPSTPPPGTDIQPLFGDKLFDDKLFDDKRHNPYPPSKRCGGLFGPLQVSQTVIESGHSLWFAGCGFVPGASVALNTSGGHDAAVSGPSGLAASTVVADGSGYISGQLTLTALGRNTITATGPGFAAAGILGDEELDPIFKDQKDVLAAAPINRTLTATVIVVGPGGPGGPGGPDGPGGPWGPGGPEGPWGPGGPEGPWDGVITDGHGNITTINGIPIPIPIPIGDWGRDKDCFKDGFNKDRKDGRTTLADGIDGRDRKDGIDGKDGRDRKDDGLFNDKDRCRDGFGGVGVGVVGVGVGGGGPGGPGGATPAGGALPFTGVETGAMASIAFALLGGGLLLRVAARRRRNTLGDHTEG